MRIFMLATVFLAVFCTVHAAIPMSRPDDLDYPADSEGDEDMQGDTDIGNYYDVGEEKEFPEGSTEKNRDRVEEPARILTQPAVFEADSGNSVTLPCDTQGNDSVIIWYKNDDILFQDTVLMHAKPNHKRENNSLVIANITKEDAGQYKCISMVSINNKAEITHHLKVRYQPNITELSVKNNETTLEVGDELVLTCHAKGYPEPVISWHKETMKDGQAVNERFDATGNRLTIPNVSRRDEGRYLCFADNKIGNPALKYISITLTHLPIVSIEKFIVNSDKDMDTELKCTVKAKPTASVVWLRNGHSLHSSEHIHLRNQENDHILVLKGLQETDFGKYVCLAKNRLGTVEKSINLVKTPAVLEFIKPEKPTRDLVLTWKVESKTPITEHELQYRKKGESEWHTVKPNVHGAEDGVYVIKYTLKDLGEGTYETRCRSQNLHGWSDYTDVTVLDVEKSTPLPLDVALAQQPEKESDIGESTNPNSASSTTASLLVCSISLLHLYFTRH
ncbi:neural cell adhesion molecule 1-like isoform X2 [Coccinella septempunctata]|uniref:neural cell adhesion molecule 1-like isoform X2 n=1 Tax=Coccinella septempunctata TaxID=41139 RepID=UPI001D06A2F0|nr:neural cell adhesion molecule 1-like isoform X2 [Coccinella septempunctata]